jgi:hypothetical protein
VIGLGLSFGLGALGGCSALDPYETIPLKQPSEAKDPRPRVGLCFDKFRSTPEKLLAAAQETCGKGMSAIPDGTDYGLGALQLCPVLLPGRATFICVPQK